MYILLKRVSLLFIALGICYSVFYGIMLCTSHSVHPLSAVFILLLFGLALLFRAIGTLGIRVTDLEKRLSDKD
jgi:hypothetical protein